MSQRLRLTRRAALDLREIHRHSVRRWGEDTAARYMADLYAAMAQAAQRPEAGLLRQRRAAPFLMIPARQHYVVYDRIDDGIVVLTLLHQMRDVETVIEGLTPGFLQEIVQLKSMH